MNGSQVTASHKPTGERNREEGAARTGQEATGYVPPSAEQAGTARHRTERWEPQAEGKQQEGTCKPLIRKQPHQSKTGRRSLEVQAPAARTGSGLGLVWTLRGTFWDGHCVHRAVLCTHWRDGLSRAGPGRATAAAAEMGKHGPREWTLAGGALSSISA